MKPLTWLWSRPVTEVEGLQGNSILMIDFGLEIAMTAGLRLIEWITAARPKHVCHVEFSRGEPQTGL